MMTVHDIILSHAGNKTHVTVHMEGTLPSQLFDRSVEIAKLVLDRAPWKIIMFHVVYREDTRDYGSILRAAHT